MKHLSHIITILLLFLLAQSASSQSLQPKNDNNQALIEDYEYFIEQLEVIHPNPYSAFGGEAGFRKKVDSLRFVLEEKENLDKEYLQRQVSQLLIPLHDGHTRCGYMNYGQEQEQRFLPINLHAMTEGFYVCGGATDYEALLGAQLIKVGGVSIDDLLDRIALLAPAENRFGLYAKLLESRLCSGALKLLLEDFEGEQVEMQFLTREGRDSCFMIPLYTPDEIRQLKGVFTSTDNRFPTKNLAYQWTDKQRGVMTFRCNSIISRDCLSFMRDNGMEYQSILERAWGDTPFDSIPTIASRFGTMLEEMKENDAQHLIIDLRGNGGGWTPIVYATLYQLFGDEFLCKDLGIQYETKLSEPYLQINNTTLDRFNADRGTCYKLGDMIRNTDGMGVAQINDSIRQQIIDSYVCLDKAMLSQQQGDPLYRPKHIYVVTDQETFSAAFHYAFMLWKMGATLVGVPSSQAPNTYMESTEFVLPNTGIPCSVSNSIQRFLPADDPRAQVFWPAWIPSYEDYKRYNFDLQSDLLYILDHLSAYK